ncbi:MAG: glycosyltransferase family 4 protein [Bacteroidales bacterium]|nr:glycosyltransferase family 4 protein [Bacteroidales bacterium]
MNILFFSIRMPNLSQDTGMYGDLVKEFVENGDKVYVVAPLLNNDSIKKTHISIENKIEVLRVKVPEVFGISNIKKGIAYPRMILKYINAVNKYFKNKKIEIAIFHTPPPENGILVKYIKKKFNCFTYLILRDFTWQDAVGFGFFKKNSLICKYYQKLDGILYKTLDSIGCMSQANIDCVLNDYPKIKKEKFHILNNFQKQFKDMSSDKSFRTQLGINDKFIVIYGGNTSIAQKIEHLLVLAESCKEYKDIVFLLLGRGSYFEKINLEANKKQLNNILFHDLIPKTEYKKLLNTCDVGLIVLNEQLSTPNIPSKSMDYFNAKIPIIASLDYVTDYGKILEDINAGLWSYSGNNIDLKNNLLRLYNNKEERIEMGKNGYDYFINNMLPIHAYKIIIENYRLWNTK